MTTVFKLARIIGVLSLLVALGGCSAIKLGYNTFADAAYWWLDGYVDFDDAQTARAREDLARLHQWHRTQELPRLAQWLQRAERLAAAPVTAAQVCTLVPELRNRLQAVGEQAEPALASLAVSLASAQLQQLERKYERNNREFRKEWVQLTPAQLLDKRLTQIAERAETVYGSVTDNQRAALRQELERSSYEPQRTLAERQRRQQDILSTLRRLAGQNASADEARTQLRSLMERLTHPPEAQERARQEAMAQETCRTLAAVHNAAAPAQRERAVQRLAAYQRDLQELAASR